MSLHRRVQVVWATATQDGTHAVGRLLLVLWSGYTQTPEESPAHLLLWCRDPRVVLRTQVAVAVALEKIAPLARMRTVEDMQAVVAFCRALDQGS
jgi:hypothetical protein